MYRQDSHNTLAIDCHRHERLNRKFDKTEAVKQERKTKRKVEEYELQQEEGASRRRRTGSATAPFRDISNTFTGIKYVPSNLVLHKQLLPLPSTQYGLKRTDTNTERHLMTLKMPEIVQRNSRQS